MSHGRKALKEIVQLLDALKNGNVQEKNVVIGQGYRVCHATVVQCPVPTLQTDMSRAWACWNGIS